jgi:hypothetical protein
MKTAKVIHVEFPRKRTRRQRKGEVRGMVLAFRPATLTDKIRNDKDHFPTHRAG